jgi:hypothetical protein
MAITGTAKETETAPVSVYEHCDCDACRNPRSAWLECPYIDRRYVDAYECGPVKFYEYLRPRSEWIAEIRAAHPGCDLVYLD